MQKAQIILQIFPLRVQVPLLFYTNKPLCLMKLRRRLLIYKILSYSFLKTFQPKERRWIGFEFDFKI